MTVDIRCSSELTSSVSMMSDLVRLCDCSSSFALSPSKVANSIWSEEWEKCQKKMICSRNRLDINGVHLVTCDLIVNLLQEKLGIQLSVFIDEVCDCIHAYEHSICNRTFAFFVLWQQKVRKQNHWLTALR